ncbi:MAG: hypothetical protein SOR74_00110 [Candidatus Faecivicinus sp.]|nr:hypothetical protein [Candidatus Faecivicinus sp.]
MERTGCLVIHGGECAYLRATAARLRTCGVAIVETDLKSDSENAALDGLRRARRADGTAILASGEAIWFALALAARMNVDKLALIEPRSARDANARAMESFARRNLFFCVSDALIVESRPGGASERIYRKMLNSRVWRLNSDGEEAMNWVVRFLTCENWLDCEPEKREKFV